MSDSRLAIAIHFISDRDEDFLQPAKRQHPRRGRKTSRKARKAAKGKGKGKET